MSSFFWSRAVACTGLYHRAHPFWPLLLLLSVLLLLLLLLPSRLRWGHVHYRRCGTRRGSRGIRTVRGRSRYDVKSSACVTWS